MIEREDILKLNGNPLLTRVQKLEQELASCLTEITQLHGLIRTLQSDRCKVKHNGFTRSSLAQSILLSNRLTGCDFSGDSIKGINLDYVSAINCGFHKIIMPDSDLNFGIFGYCDFSDAYLKNSKLTESRFKDCDFRYAVLDHADLSGSYFINCDFMLANFTESVLAGTRFKGCSFTITPDNSSLSKKQLASAFFDNCSGLDP